MCTSLVTPGIAPWFLVANKVARNFLAVKTRVVRRGLAETTVLSTRRAGHLLRVSLSSYSYRCVPARMCRCRRDATGVECSIQGSITNAAHIGALRLPPGCHWCVGCTSTPLATAGRGVRTSAPFRQAAPPKSCQPPWSISSILFVRGVACAAAGAAAGVVLLTASSASASCSALSF